MKTDHEETGEELACFWLHAERILGIDENDETQKALYLSLIRVLKVTHLRAGSAVMESCSISSESVAQLKHWYPPGRQRDVLNSLQTEALEKLHKYWVPGFLSHCQVCLSRFPKGSILLEIRQQSTTGRDFSDPLPMSIEKQEKSPAIYSSEVNKRRQWHLLTFGIGSNHDSYFETRATCQPNLKESNCMNSSVNKNSGCRNVLVPTSTRTESSFIVQPLPQNMQEPCGAHKTLLPHPQDTPITCQFLSLGLDLRNTELISDWLHWALSAEDYASGPFHAFLMKKGEHEGVRLVSLWKELRVILWVLLRKDSMVLCRVLSHQLCQNYLQEEKDKFSKTSCKTDSCPSQLIVRRLRQLLPFQDALPWVLQAQTQVCQSLCSLYKQFLDEEDRIFLQFVSSKFLEVNPDTSVNSYTGEICINRIQRIKAALALAQACAHGEEIEPLDSEAWKILVTEDLSQGGSLKPPPQPEGTLKLDFSKMSFEELVLWNPKLAIEMMSKQFHSLNLYKSSTESILQCGDASIQEFVKTKSLPVLVSAQSSVFRSMEIAWFRRYQNLFPDFPETDSEHGKMKRHRDSFSLGKTVRMLLHLYEYHQNASTAFSTALDIALHVNVSLPPFFDVSFPLLPCLFLLPPSMSLSLPFFHVFHSHSFLVSLFPFHISLYPQFNVFCPPLPYMSLHPHFHTCLFILHFSLVSSSPPSIQVFPSLPHLSSSPSMYLFLPFHPCLPPIFHPCPTLLPKRQSAAALKDPAP
ncbi:Hypothetical predicted protein [Pelobates cultripes]|uniref:RGS domain-containing protein n=1 Tax=Pelobates cultripes TaxID=61616 RepID=A0AAD1SVU8_PELCU|nr:Hypothetical predicted protein [Pelobates cultripes]